jgi:predicted nucleotidyltransferase component of viral defense system
MMTVVSGEQSQHRDVLVDFLQYLNQRSQDFVLKGGTALAQCYGLDRFSEDVDLDAIPGISLRQFIAGYCEMKGFEIPHNKYPRSEIRETYNLHYAGDARYIKIEVSHRPSYLTQEATVSKDGVLVYDIDNLAILKTLAYTGRAKARDLYDVAFIVNEYFDNLSEQTKQMIYTAFAYNEGMERVDWIIVTDPDPYVAVNKIYDRVIRMFDQLDILDEETSA